MLSRKSCFTIRLECVILRQALITVLGNQSHEPHEPNHLYCRKTVLNSIESQLWKRLAQECVSSVKPRIRPNDQSRMPCEPLND